MQAGMCVCACDVYDMYVYVSNLSYFSAFVTLFIFFLEFCFFAYCRIHGSDGRFLFMHLSVSRSMFQKACPKLNHIEDESMICCLL